MENVISIHSLKKIFRDFWLRPTVTAVDGIDFDVGKGEVFGLLGPNGSGKSTTIKLILGLLSPTAGKIEVFGSSPRSLKVKARLGYLPELSHLHPFLTAREAIRYYAGLSGMSSADSARRAEELIEQVGLQGAADRPVGGYSKGMARRVGLAAALVAKPELLVLDEPTSGLDPIGTREVKELVRSLAKGGVTVLMTSHLLGDVADVCDRIVILAKGKVAAQGRLEDLLSRRDATSFTLPGVSPEDAAAAAELLKAKFGRDPEVSHPKISLEQFFVDTVKGGGEKATDAK